MNRFVAFKREAWVIGLGDRQVGYKRATRGVLVNMSLFDSGGGY